MAEQEVKVRPVGGDTCSIIVKGEDRMIWERYASNRLSLTVITILVFVYVVSKMEDIVHRVFASRISKSVEEAKREIAA